MLLTRFRVYHACAPTNGFYVHSQVDAKMVVVDHIGGLPLESDDLEGGGLTLGALLLQFFQLHLQSGRLIELGGTLLRSSSKDCKFWNLICLYFIPRAVDLRWLCWAIAIIINVLVVLIWAGFDHALANALQVEVGQEAFEALIFAVQLHEKFLGVATRLSARASSHVLLDPLPLFAEALQSLEESKVLIHGPTSYFSIFRGELWAHLRRPSRGLVIVEELFWVVLAFLR
jgi:hypothetical protein